MNPWAWISIVLIMLGVLIIIAGVKGSLKNVCISLTGSSNVCSFLPGTATDTSSNGTSKQGSTGSNNSSNAQIITTPAPGAV